jgi:hypothetical protein
VFIIKWGGNFIAKTDVSRERAEEMVAEHKANRVPIRARHIAEFGERQEGEEGEEHSHKVGPEPEYDIEEC